MKETNTSIRGKVIREAIAHVTNNHLIGQKLKSGEYRKSLGVNEPAWKCPDCFLLTVVDMPDFQMELLESKENKRQDKILMQFHGGGYVSGMRNDYRMFAGLYNEVGHGISVLTVDYRVAPENPYPAAVLDAFAAYEWLLEQGWDADQIILAGDSAGGGLAMVLCHYLKDKNMQLPCGIIAMSPWTDLTTSGESYDTNFERDPLFGGTRNSILYRKDYVGENDPSDKYISPLFGEFKDFPPMLIQVGSYEMLLSDSVSAAAKAREQGVKVRLSIYEGMFHVFQMAAKMLPEAKKAWVEIGRFIDVLTDD